MVYKNILSIVLILSTHVACAQDFCRGYLVGGASYQCFEPPRVDAIRDDGRTTGSLDGYGAFASAELFWRDNCVLELRGDYSRAEHASTAELDSGFINLLEIDGSGNNRSKEASTGVNDLDLRLYGGDFLLRNDFYCSLCYKVGGHIGLSYKRLDQRHKFFGRNNGQRVKDFFTRDQVDTDYYGGTLGFRAQTTLLACFYVTLTGKADLYYACDHLKARQLLDNFGPFRESVRSSCFAANLEGKLGLTLIDDCFIIGVNGFIGHLTHAPQVIHPVEVGEGSSFLKSRCLTRYGVEGFIGFYF